VAMFGMLLDYPPFPEELRLACCSTIRRGASAGNKICIEETLPPSCGSKHRFED